MANNLLAVSSNRKIVPIALLASTVCLVPSTSPAQAIDESNFECNAQYVVPEADFEVITDSRVAAWVKFQGLRRQWVEERGAKASVLEMAMLPSYQNIIGMGEEAVPLILAQLQSEGEKPDHWFWALGAITRDNPVSPQYRGRVREMAKAWLEWGANKGYVQVG